MKRLAATELEITFINACPPPLPDGDFQIAVEQTVSWNGGSLDQPISSKYNFSIFGPRFTLDPVEIHAVFPPPAHRGHFQKYLPHMVFRRRSLPWERTLDGELPGEIHYPWIWLTTLSEQEIIDNGIEVKTVKLAEVFTSPDPGVLLTPDIRPETGDDLSSQCLVVDMPVALFQQIVPSLDDLEFMASARLVSVENKELTLATEDGWFSTVIANRFSANGSNNTQFLFSLEGYQAVLYPHSVGATYERIRLVMLANWNFTNVDDEQTFDELMANLSVDRMQLPELGQSNEVSRAFSMGYAPMNHDTLEGELLVSWYRGPFLPLEMPLNMPFTYPNSDAALRYDPEFGMFDVTYAAAIQIGRFLGLRSTQFATALANLRGFNQAQMIGMLQRVVLFQGLHQDLELSAEFFQHFNNNQVDDRILAWWARKLGPALAGKDPILGPPGDPSGLRDLIGRMPGLLKPKQLHDLTGKSRQSMLDFFNRSSR